MPCKKYFYLQNKDFSESDTLNLKSLATIKIKKLETDINRIKNEIEKIFIENLKICSEIRTYKINQFLNQHVGQYLCGVYSEDFNILVTGGTDSTIRFWDLKLEKQVYIINEHYGEVRCLALAQNSKYLISASDDGNLIIWDFQGKTLVAKLKGGHRTRINDILYLENPPRIISVCCFGKLIVWDFFEHNIKKKISQPDLFFSLCLMKDQSTIIVGSKPHIYLYDLDTGNMKYKLEGHKERVLSIKILNNQRTMISASEDQSIMVWDLINRKLIKKFKAHNSKINILAVCLDEKFVISGSDDAIAKIWSIETFELVKTFNDHAFHIRCILPFNKAFITLAQNSEIGYLNINNEKILIKRLLKPFLTDSICISYNSKFIAYGSKNQLFIWDLEKEKDILVLNGHNDYVYSVDISRDGKFAISGSMDIDSKFNLIYWNLEIGQKLFELEGHKHVVGCVALSKDNLRAASGSNDKTIRIWNLTRGSEDCKFEKHQSSILSVKFIENKSFVVSGGIDFLIIIWSYKNNNIYAELLGHNHYIYKILVTPDEKYILSADHIYWPRTWNIEEKKQDQMFDSKKGVKAWIRENNLDLYEVKKFIKDN